MTSLYALRRRGTTLFAEATRPPHCDRIRVAHFRRHLGLRPCEILSMMAAVAMAIYCE
jgi:hypothetical protein